MVWPFTQSRGGVCRKPISGDSMPRCTRLASLITSRPGRVLLAQSDSWPGLVCETRLPCRSFFRLIEPYKSSQVVFGPRVRFFTVCRPSFASMAATSQCIDERCCSCSACPVATARQDLPVPDGPFSSMILCCLSMAVSCSNRLACC